LVPRSPTPTSTPPSPRKIQMRQKSPTPAPNVKKEALLGKVLNTGRFNPNVVRIVAIREDGKFTKDVQGIQTESVVITVKHAGWTDVRKDTYSGIRADGKVELKVDQVNNKVDIMTLMPPKQVPALPKWPMRAAVAGEEVQLLTRNEKGEVIGQPGRIINHEEHDCATPNEGGFSGAPIVANSDGKLVGMHIGAMDGKSTNAYLPVGIIDSIVNDSKNKGSPSGK